jgi:hypothetical protein
MKWEDKSIEFIIGGTSPDGTRYLKQFLKDYSKLTGETVLNASCNNCIKDYHKKYIRKMKPNKSNYVLKEKYNGIPLEHNILVTNANMTNELGEALLNKRGAHLFSKLPTEAKEPETVIETPVKKTRKPRAKKAQ